MSARTPGEWIAKQMLNHAQFVILWPDNSKGGMHMRRVDAGGTFREPDARLIASAPCLLRELQRADDVIAVLWAHMSEGVASRVMTDLLSRGLSETSDTRRAAIRKATGESA